MNNSKNIELFKRFLKDFWPKHRNQLYRDLYKTYHPSTYAERFSTPSGNFENALETLADAVHEGKKLGLLDSSVDWSDIYNYDALRLSSDEQVKHPGIDDDGIETLNDQLEIMDNTNLDWIHGILLFDVLEDIVEEFRCYCGENDVDPNCEGKCMDEFPPDAQRDQGYSMDPKAGTLKQDYYTLYGYMRRLEEQGINPTDYMKSPLYPSLIKLVDTGSTDYDEEGKQRKKYALIDKIIDDTIDAEKDQDDIDAEEILMDVPERLEEQEDYPEPEPTKSMFQKTLEDMGVQFQFVGTFGFGISGMFGFVKELLEGEYPTLSEGEITLIFLSALSYLSINTIKDIQRLRQEVKGRGLGGYVNKVVALLKDFENISLKVVEKAGFTVSSLAELLGYTFLLVPILDITNRIINETGFSVDSLSSYLKGAIVSVGIFYIKNVFNSLVLRLKKLRTDKAIDLEDEDEEIIEEGMWVGKILSERFKNSRVITDERIGKLSLIDESVENKNLKWLVEQENKINWLNIPLSKSIERFNKNKDLFTKTNIQEVTNKFRHSNPKDLNNYKSIIELNHINNQLTKNSKLHEEVYMSKIAERATTDIVRDIFEIITVFEGGEEYVILPDYYTEQDGDEYRYGELQFNVELNIIENDQEENFTLDSAIGGEYDDTIYVDIILSTNFTEKDYESIQIVLSEYIRHEIEHILQGIDPDRPALPDEDLTQKSLNLTPFEYYTQDYELDAQKVGFERRAKMEDKSVEEVIKDYLEYRQAIDNLSDMERQELIGKLTN